MSPHKQINQPRKNPFKEKTNPENTILRVLVRTLGVQSHFEPDNCSSSLFAALKRMVLGRENACVSQHLDFWGRRLGVVQVPPRWPQVTHFVCFSLQNPLPYTSPRQITLRFRCRLGAVQVSFRCRLGGRMSHLLVGFHCKIIPNRVPPNIKYHCDLGAV